MKANLTVTESGSFMKVPVRIKGKILDALIDSASTGSFITKRRAGELGLRPSEKVNLYIKPINEGESCKATNVYHVPVLVDPSSGYIPLQLHENLTLPENADVMLGHDSFSKLKARITFTINHTNLTKNETQSPCDNHEIDQK